MVEENLSFTLHVIPPPMRLDWSSPRGLFITTFLNHLRGDLAPIGHFFIEFTLPSGAASQFHPKVAPLIDGGKVVISGMSRKKMTFFESFRTVQGKRLGLGTLYFDFKGKLDSVQEARHEIEWAKHKKRYASIQVRINSETANQMLDFMKDWIERGSFRHYSGGLRVDCGEGAGCAEFGMHFFSMALGVHAVNPDWMRRVRVPHALIGGGFAGDEKKVTMADLLMGGNRWAYGHEAHHVYSIPDPELVFDWIKDHLRGDTGSRPALVSDDGSPIKTVRSMKSSLGEWNTTLIPGEVTWSTGSFSRKEFTVDYPRESMGSIQEQWARVIEKGQ
jgi:hypothetical protein